MFKSRGFACLTKEGRDEEDEGVARSNHRGRGGHRGADHVRHTGRVTCRRADQDRRLAVAQRRLLRSRHERQEGLRALGGVRERPRGDPRPAGPAGDQGRRIEPGPGRHELPQPDHAGQGRSRLRPVLVALDRARGDRRQPLPLRDARAGGRRAEGLRAQAAQLLLRPAGAGRQVRRPVRRVHQVAAEVAAAEDGLVPLARRPVRVADRGCDAGEVRGDGRQDALPRHLPGRDDRRDAGRREGDCRQAGHDRGRHPVGRRLQPGEGADPGEVQPEVPVLRQRRERAGRVPEQGRPQERQRHLQLQRLDADRAHERQPAVRADLPEEVRRQPVRHRQQLCRGVGGGPAPPGRRQEDRGDRQPDPDQGPARGQRGRRSRGTCPGTPAARRTGATCSSSGSAGSWLRSTRSSSQSPSPSPRSRPGGCRRLPEDRCTSSSKPASWASSRAASMR